MTRVTIYRNTNGQYTGFDCTGHAAFGEYGQDFVCAGVSALVINTINSIAIFSNEKFETDSDEETGRITLNFLQPAYKEADLFMKSLVLGLQAIQNNYGNDYIILNFEEV
ncbi:MAG: ribosomal-processing cysteine protease Prp [Lachnospiraceae bacterium]